MKQGQFPAVFNLTDLNGQNGFKLDGENNGDASCSSSVPLDISMAMAIPIY